MRIGVQQLRDMKRRNERIAMLTAYDYTSARLLDEAGIPALLVGDTLGMVIYGYDTTLPVTMEDMLRHTQAVVRGSSKAMVIADLPFLSYQVSPEDAIRNAGRLIQEGGAQAVKLEGGTVIAATIRRIVDCGIPLMAHIGLTPQAVHQLGGYRVQGKTLEVASRLLEDAEAVEQAGAFSVVLEGVPTPLAALITSRLSIPTIGIGAGVHCDGQVQVYHDLMGLYTDFKPRHARRFALLGEQVKTAARQYLEGVVASEFPTDDESFTMDDQVMRAINERFGKLTPTT